MYSVSEVVDDYIKKIRDTQNKDLFINISGVLIKIIELNCLVGDMQNLFYALMYYLISKNKDHIYDISFNNLISKEEHKEEHKEERDGYERLINKLLTNVNSEKKDFAQFYENTKEYNKTISNEITSSTNNTSENLKLKDLINSINIEIRKCGQYDKTIEFRKNIFGLEYGSFFGIANNAQSAGSCAFYSVYNLMISMKLRAEYNFISELYTITEAVNSFVNSYLEFHYHMLKLLKMTIDKNTVIDLLSVAKSTQNFNIS